MASELDDRDRRDAEALVDGSLQGARRAAFEQRVSLEPELRAAVERLMAERVAAAERAGGVHEHAEVASRSRRGGPRPMLALLVGLGAGVAVLLAGLLFVVTAVNTSSVSAQDVAAVSVRTADSPAPGPDRAAPALLEQPFADVPFPHFEPAFNFDATGSRVDTVEGRTVRTVQYSGEVGRIAYSVVSGPPLVPPPDVSLSVVSGVTLYEVPSPLGRAVVWERMGHTCVLSGDLPSQRLRQLATWNGGGRVPF